MVRFRLPGTPVQVVVERLRARGVLVLAADRLTLRAVTNLMVTAEDIRRAVEIIAKAAGD